MATAQYMILDNDGMNSNVLKAMLEFIGDCGCQIYTSPEQLLIALENNKPDVIFCHVTARGCDSRELLMHSELDTPLIFISALKKSEERRQCYIDSDYPYMSYPLSVGVLQSQLLSAQ